MRQLFGNLGFTNACRAGKQIAANRLFRFAQTGTCQLDCTGDGLNRLVLTKDNSLKITFKIGQCLAIIGRYRFWWYAGDLGDDFLDIAFGNRAFALAWSHQHPGCPDLVDHINRAIGTLTVVDIA